jgi:hypothetical protein
MAEAQPEPEPEVEQPETSYGLDSVTASIVMQGRITLRTLSDVALNLPAGAKITGLEIDYVVGKDVDYD